MRMVDTLNMSTAKQINAYREILHTRQQEHLRKTYGMQPVAARFMGKCGCGRIFGEGSGWAAGTPCRFDRGNLIAKYKGEGWWNLSCIDTARQDEFKANARYVREALSRRGWVAFDWTNEARQADLWREELEFDAEAAARERVTDRQEVK
jgi:hypothetical protein